MDPLLIFDKALEKYRKDYNLRRDKDVVEINLSNSGLCELRSLEQFKNLTRLWLSSNSLRQLSFIQSSYSLSELYLQYNLIKSIDGLLRNLTNIKVLFLHANEINDLTLTAKELSYLKNLRNLSLFENPIALEKNYKSSIIHACPLLDIFDRNTISKNDRDRSIRLFEPEKLALQEKYAFRRTVDSMAMSNNKPFDLNRLSTNSRSNQPDVNNSDEMKNDLNHLINRRSVKEFSHFDWSKVALEVGDNHHDEAVNNSSSRSLNNSNQLPQIVTVRFM